MSNDNSDITHSNKNDATVESNVRPEYDVEIQKIADYVLNYSMITTPPIAQMLGILRVIA